jgi:hypothetical protein
LLSAGFSKVLNKFESPKIEYDEFEAGIVIEEAFDSLDYVALVDPLDELRNFCIFVTLAENSCCRASAASVFILYQVLPSST